MASLETLPPVAKSIFLECKKCGVDRYLKVLTHVDDKKFKTECEVCHSVKTHSIGKKKAATGRKRAAAKPQASHSQIWLSLKESADLSQAKPYSMKSHFEDKAIIDHPKFGLGFVTASNSQAIEVQFEDSSRSLVHNRNS